jgi:N-acetylneuraminate lyase
MKPIRPLHEFVAAVFTPMHGDGSIAPEVVPAQAAFLAANGIRTVFITGTTGECHSLTCDERLTLYEAWAPAARSHGLSVVAHVGGNSIEDARTLAHRAAALDFAAISALAPSYFKPVTMQVLVDWCAAVAGAAPGLPFYYYDIPSLTGVTLPIDRFLESASARIPTLAGVKFTNPDLIGYRRALDAGGGRFDLPWGIYEALLGGLATGARGGVGSTYNFAPRLYTGLVQAFDRGDLAAARRLQSLSIALVDAIGATGYIGTAKALVSRLGVPVGPARAPLTNPSAADVDALMERLASLGFAEWGAQAPAAGD